MNLLIATSMVLPLAVFEPAQPAPEAEAEAATAAPQSGSTEPAAADDGEAAEAPVTDAPAPTAAESASTTAAPATVDPMDGSTEASPTGADPSWDATAPAPAATEPAPVAAPKPPPAPVNTPRPIRWRLDFELGGGMTLVGDRGYRAFAPSRALPEGHAGAVFDFRLAQGRVFVGGGLSYHRLERNGGIFGSDVNTSMILHEPLLMGRVSVMAVEGVDAFGQVGIGPSFVQTDFSSTETASQDHVIPRFDAHGGLSLYLPKKWLPRKKAARVSAGLQLGLGLTWRGGMEVEPALYQDDDPLDARVSPLGDLNLFGMSWRAALFLRVM